ncbi:MAG: protein kinase domain-containing protein, partial [Candidatus Dormibacteraceae bacterium]
MEVALKVLDFGPSAQPGFLDRFQADLARLGNTHHPHLLTVYEHGVFHDLAYVVYGLAPGGSLADLLKLGPLNLETALPVIIALAEVLQWAHEYGLVHRDIKPGNVLFDTDGTPLLTGFGLAPTYFGFAVGTPGYMSPEQAQGGAGDQRSDVYGLAAVVFEMLSGTALHQEESDAELLRVTTLGPPAAITDRSPELPHRLNNILWQALSNDPDQRPNTPLEFLSALEQVLGRPGEGPPFSGQEVDSEKLSEAAIEAEFERRREHTIRLMESSLCAAVAIDETGYVVSWNRTAEITFGWTREEIMGRTLSSTLIPSRYREGHERGFRRYLDGGRGQMMGQVVELSAIDRLGREFPIELSLAPAIRSGKRMVVFGFIRDISSEKRAERLHKAENEALQALEAGEALGSVVPRMLEAIATGLGC